MRKSQEYYMSLTPAEKVLLGNAILDIDEALKPETPAQTVRALLENTEDRIRRILRRQVWSTL